MGCDKRLTAFDEIFFHVVLVSQLACAMPGRACQNFGGFTIAWRIHMTSGALATFHTSALRGESTGASRSGGALSSTLGATHPHPPRSSSAIPSPVKGRDEKAVLDCFAAASLRRPVSKSKMRSSRAKRGSASIKRTCGAPSGRVRCARWAATRRPAYAAIF